MNQVAGQLTPLVSNTDKIYPALAKVKSELGAIVKSANNPFFKSKYADLNTHLDAVEPLLEKNGLVLLQPVVAGYGAANVVYSQIIHVESGQSVSSSMSLVGETDMQKAGSGITYARRYTLGSLLSMKAEDDDGEGSMNRGAKTTTTKTATSKGTSSSSFRKNTKKTETKTETVTTGDDI